MANHCALPSSLLHWVNFLKSSTIFALLSTAKVVLKQSRNSCLPPSALYPSKVYWYKRNSLNPEEWSLGTEYRSASTWGPDWRLDASSHHRATSLRYISGSSGLNLGVCNLISAMAEETTKSEEMSTEKKLLRCRNNTCNCSHQELYSLLTN